MLCHWLTHIITGRGESANAVQRYGVRNNIPILSDRRTGLIVVKRD
jgi:hypothetical protein